jgi:zinc protease
MAAQIEPRADAEVVEFAYTDFGTPGVIVSDEVEPLLGIREITFANGVKLNLKQTDLEDDQVQVQLNVDGGDLLNTRDDPLATAMTSSLLTGGLGEHTLDELQTILAGRRVGLSIESADETFRFSAQTTPGDLDLQLQLFAAALADAGYRSTGEAQYHQNVRNFFARLNATPESTLSNAEGAILSDNDPRFSLQPEEQYLDLTFAELQSDIDERLKNGALEVALVGDFDEQRAIDLVANTLGALPAREAEFGAYTDARDREFTQNREQRTLYHEGPPDQALLKMVWKTRDDDDFQDTLALELLERVARLELTDTLREELGQTYSPGVSASQSRVYPGYGTFSISAAVDVEDVPETRAAMLATIESLRDAEVDGDTLLRARQPLLETYDNLLKTNMGWMGLVDRAQTEPERIERYDRADAVLQSLMPAQLQEMARRYLAPAERVEIVVLPEDEGE